MSVSDKQLYDAVRTVVEAHDSRDDSPDDAKWWSVLEQWVWEHGEDLGNRPGGSGY